MTIFVLDNSVTMRWCFDGGTHVYADSVLNDLAKPGSMALVPILWRYEVSSVLARAEIVGQLTAKFAAKFAANFAAEFLDVIEGLNIQVDEESSQRIFSDVHRLAITYRLTSYDAAYLELAQRRDLPLATLDAELITASKLAGIRLL